MSGEGPESIPTSADPRSKRPTKKRALTPVSAQSAHLDALFARPDQEIRLPATSSNPSSRIKAPPEIVTNVQGSSAGAGSGEFHVYKASRRREYERLRVMDEELREEKGREEFEAGRSERERRDEEKTRRNRERREKMRARKDRAKGGARGDGGGGRGAGYAPASGGGGAAGGKAGPKIVVSRERDEDDDAETEMQDAAVAVADEPKGLIVEDD